ncbi:MAG: subclass B3 metallo-beta-lactamase [Sphingorhabdus sp.]
MFGKWSILAAVALAACAPVQQETTTVAKTFESITTACGERDGWSDPAPPAHVFGNTYMVGTCGITALLITTPEGHFLIDGATNEAAEGIAENIRKLGFKPEDVKLLLITHEHLDHAGGISQLKQITQSKFAARQPALAAMASGLPDPSDPQHGLHPAFPGVQADFLIGDGDTLRSGNQVVTVIATPGHSPGGTSYIWKSCEKTECRTIVYADSLNAVSADAYRFSDHPDYVATLRRSMARIEAIKDCDIMISPHPFQSDFFERLAGEMPLIDQSRCKQYVTAAKLRLDTRLAKEAE